MTFAGTWTTAAVALGGNVGDVAEGFATALDHLAGDSACRVSAVSSLWRTQAWGRKEQPDFLNAVVLLETRLGADELLARLKREEQAAGRTRGERWGPRPLDLDALWYGAEIRNEAHLRLPHPHLAQRSFVLAPALEVAPDWTHPGTGTSLGEMRKRLVASDGWTRCDPMASAPDWWARCKDLVPAVTACRS